MTRIYNRQQHTEYMRKYRKTKAHADYMRKYRAKNRERDRKYRSNRLRKFRQKVLDAFGNKCSDPECPIPIEKMDPRCLQIDHINNDGHIDRKIKRCSGAFYYRKVLKDIENGGEKYQLLCVYCNWKKELERRSHR